MRTMDHLIVASAALVIAIGVAGGVMMLMPGCTGTAETSTAPPDSTAARNTIARHYCIDVVEPEHEATEELGLPFEGTTTSEAAMLAEVSRATRDARKAETELEVLMSTAGSSSEEMGAPMEIGESDAVIFRDVSGGSGIARLGSSIEVDRLEISRSFSRGGVETSGSRPRQTPRVNAASHDDNEEYLPWLDFMDRNRDVSGTLSADFTDRFVIRMVDAAGAPVMNQEFVLRDARGKNVWSGTTCADGEAVVYPHVFFREVGVPPSVIVNGEQHDCKPAMEGIVRVALGGQARELERYSVDIAFIIDATGSMADEIQQLRDVLFSIHSRLQRVSDAADLRFAMVVYRDRTDSEPLAVVPFTGDVNQFEQALARVRASGGGDYPEDLQGALVAALGSLDWRKDAIRAAFVLADAPPHTDYAQQQDYLASAREANSRGIRIHTIGASGLRVDGEYIFRQISAATAGQFIFLTYGETGESSGSATASDPGRVSHHTGANYTSRRLDDIVVGIVRRDLAYHVDLPELTADAPAPETQSEMLSLRMHNLWGQIARQISEARGDTLTAVLLPFEDALSDTSLATYLHDLSLEVMLDELPVMLVERERIDAVMAEHGLAAGGLVSEGAAVELGNILGGTMVFCGRVYSLGADRVVHVRAVDSETARIVAAARVRV